MLIKVPKRIPEKVSAWPPGGGKKKKKKPAPGPAGRKTKEIIAVSSPGPSPSPEGGKRKYFVHQETKNPSFLREYHRLEAAGVTTFRFMGLSDVRLKHVDPHSPRLTVDEKRWIYTECTHNKWYFLREIVRIQRPGGLSKYELNPGNLAQSWCMSKNLNFISVLPRQSGKTIGVICDDVWLYHFGTTNTNMIYGNKELADSNLNLKRFKDITDSLPEWLRYGWGDKDFRGILSKRNDTDNIESKRSAKSNNTIRSMSSPKETSAADRAG